MSDEKMVPETLETIAASIRELRQSMESQFDQVASRSQVNSRFVEINSRFGKVDSRFDELKAQLRTEIESLRGDIRLVAEAFGAQAMVNERNESAHTEFKKRLDHHDTRIAALDRGEGPSL
jgi:chaperonin cofactor prefoldin